MKTLYRLDHVSKCHGDITALDLDSLTIARGTLTVLQGGNGAGKSTLLSLLAFLSVPTTGEILFDGAVVGSRPGQIFGLRRQVTLLHQSPYLFKGTVADNVAFGLRMRGMPRNEQRKLVVAALAMVGLLHFEERMAHMLSGGEAQRVALARALVMNPKVLLLDEPFAAVDGETAAAIESVLRTQVHRGGTIILSSHDRSVADRLNANVIKLSGGRIAGPSQITVNPERLYAKV